MIGSVFGELLNALLKQVPHSRVAVFADWEGEMVDLAITTRLYDIQEARIRAAHWGIIYFLARDRLLGITGKPAESFVLQFTDEIVMIRAVDEHYFLTLSLSPDANVGIAASAADKVCQQLRGEM